MKKFALKTKNGEVINTTSAYDINDAILNFASRKRLSTEQLLNIFDVDDFIR